MNNISIEGNRVTKTLEPITALEASVRKAQSNHVTGYAKIRALLLMAPELSNWETFGADGTGTKLLQFHPGDALGRGTLMSQTSVMSIVTAIGGRAEARGDGSVEIHTADGYQLIFHRAVATFTINLGTKA